MNKSVAIIGTRGYPSYYGGFETAVRRLAPYLADQGWDVTVYGRSGAAKTDDPLHDSRVKTVVTRGIESKSLSTLSHGLTACIHAAWKRPDVSLVMNVANGYWLPILRSRGIPTLINVDGIEWDRAKWNRLAKFIFHTGARVTARLGTRMVYDSREIARRWEEEFRVEGDFIPYGGDEQGPLPIETGLSNRGYILIVARFVPENSVPEFVDAARELSKRWPVVIVGSSGYGGELDDAVADLQRTSGNVIWLGHLADDRRLHSLWQHAGAYFHGHSVGGTNPALVQAMACGAPVVARDTPYNREVMGENGVYVQPTPGSIIEGITDVMENPALQEELAESALARAREEYSWELVNSRYHRALSELTQVQKTKARQRRA
jgi:glycosyltransferase involved in cell wall biosynthesis